MRIVPVGVDALGDFLAVADAIERDHPATILPLRQALALELSGQSAFARHGRQQLFVADVGGRAVGRIAALVNTDLRDGSGAPWGQLGYFEAPDDQAIANALFEAGAAWLRKQGARRLYAPMNGGAHRLHRLMVRGFERAPFLFEPRNPAYYPRLFEAWGLAPKHRWMSYELARPEVLALGRRFGRVLQGRPPPGTIDVVDPRDLSAVLGRLHHLLDGFWRNHVGYASLALDEFAEVFAGALAIMTPRNLGFLAHEGRDVGCAFMYPDWADEARALAGDATGWAAWMARQPAPRASRLIMHTLALLPEARFSSAGLALLAHGLGLFEADGFDELLVALVVDGLLTRQLGPPTREYALYERSL
jgi:hypothetical protein